MLSEAVRRQLTQLVFDKLGVVPSSAVLRLLVGEELARGVPVFQQGYDYAVWVVSIAIEQPSPEVFLDLVAEVDPAGGVSDLRDVVDRLKQDRSRWQLRRTDVLVVHDDQPFVDRAKLKPVIQRLLGPTPPKADVLVVEGGLGSGKTHVRGYCEKLVASHPGIQLASFEATPATARNLDPGLVGGRLGPKLGARGQRPRRHEDHNRWARNVASWLARTVQQSASLSVVALEGLDTPAMPEAIHVLVAELLRLMRETPKVRRRLRVILLGYDLDRLRRLGVMPDAQVLEHVDQQMLMEWFELRYPARPRYQYEEAAQFVLEGIPASGPMRMQALCNEVIAASAGFES